MNNSAQKHILIIEDEKPLVEALSRKLKSEEFSVTAVFDGGEVSEAIAKIKPDLILPDLILPVVDGVTVLKNLKSSPDTKNIPVMVLANLADDEKVAEVLAAGGSEYPVKVDYSLDDVVAAVRQKLEKESLSE